MKWLSQDLNYLLGLVEISTAYQVDDDFVGAQNCLAKGLRLAVALNNLDLLVG